MALSAIVYNGYSYSCGLHFTLGPKQEDSNEIGAVLEEISLSRELDVPVNSTIEFRLCTENFTQNVKGTYLGNGRIKL